MLDGALPAQKVAGVWCKLAEAEVKAREFQEVTLVEFNELRGKVEQLEGQAQEARERGGVRSWRA